MTTHIAEERDYFTDHSVLLDPYEYFEDIRARGPVCRLKNREHIIVTGYDEAISVLNNSQDFSSVITTSDQTRPLPFTPSGEDITDQIEAHREEISGTNLLVSQDDGRHANARSLLTGLFTPSRLRANHDFMRELSELLVAAAVAKGGCDLVREVATPYVTLVVANLLGVPTEDRDKFRAVLDEAPPPADINKGEDEQGGASLGYALERMGGFFAEYMLDRRQNPRADVLTELAQATYSDGATPDLMEIVTLAVFLFAAGGDTSAKLLGNGIRILAENRELQQQLREDRSLIPAFLEEVLRVEGSTKCTFRLAKRQTRIGDVDVLPGDKILILLSATSHDPRRWENPTEFRLGRTRVREHLAFGRGKHTCVGAPLARAEVRVMLDTLLDRTSNISLSEAHHGPTGNRKFDYEPSYIIRGLKQLHIKLETN
jgi:cytochrome P450